MLRALAKVLIRILDVALYVIDSDYRKSDEIIDDVKKFTHTKPVDFQSDFGHVSSAHRTVPYETWLLKTNRRELIAADKHLVVKEDGSECYMEDLRVGDSIQTDDGVDIVIQCCALNIRMNMYDISVEHDSHHYYSNGIKSHNTTTAAGYLLWYAMFQENQKILVLSKDKTGALEIMDRLWYAYEELPWWLKPGVKVDQVHTKVFENGSVVTALATTKTSGRGRSVSLLYLDEFAFVQPNIVSEFWTAIWPTLSTGGKCIITSTPNTDEDKFAKIWFNAKMSPFSEQWEDKIASRQLLDDSVELYETMFENDGLREDPRFMDFTIADDDGDEDELGFVGFFASWTKVPDDINGGFRGTKFRRQTLAAGTSVEEFLREFECSFVTGDSTLISSQKLAILNHLARPPRFIDKHGVRWFEEILPNVGYGVVLDPSEGKDLDDACIQVVELPTLRQVAEWNDNTVDQVQQTVVLQQVLRRLYITQQNHPEHSGEVNIYYSVERNGLGIGILNIIELEGEEKFKGWLLDSSATSINARGSSGMDTTNKWRGLITTVSTKKRYCLEFKSLVERNLFTPRSATLISQMKTFVKHGNSWAAKGGTKDDVIMGQVLMCHLIDELRYHEPDLEDYLRINLEDDYDQDDMTHEDNMPFLPIV